MCTHVCVVNLSGRINETHCDWSYKKRIQKRPKYFYPDAFMLQFHIRLSKSWDYKIPSTFYQHKCYSFGTRIRMLWLSAKTMTKIDIDFWLRAFHSIIAKLFIIFAHRIWETTLRFHDQKCSIMNFIGKIIKGIGKYR